MGHVTEKALRIANDLVACLALDMAVATVSENAKLEGERALRSKAYTASILLQ